jgi:long-chain acyl-CoA synthetase
MNLIQAVKRGAEQESNKVFLVCEKQKRTFKQFYERVMTFGSGLAGLGVKPGDKIALLLNNSIEFLETYFGVIAAGGIIVPINTFLKADEIIYIMNNCGCKALVTSADFKVVLADVKTGQIMSLENVISIDELPGAKTVKYENLMTGEKIAEKPLNQDDPAVIIYTSGTTGHPKGAVLSHRNLISDVDNSKDIISVTKKDIFMCFLPMFHSYSFTATCMIPVFCMCKLVIVRSIQPFARVVKNMLLHRVSVFIAIPPIYSVMAEKKIPFYVLMFNALRLCISGGASLPVEIIKKFEAKFKKPLIEGYGLSEAAPICALNPLHGTRKPGSIGPPINNVQIIIGDENGKEVAVEEMGELVIKGDNVMLGYYNNPEATKETIKNGWLYTGDMGKKDKDGYVYILDRKKDMVIVNGMNVYPREVEEILYSHPAIADAAVIGEKHEVHGEIPVAVVLLKEGAAADEHGLRKFLREHIANYKVPHRIEFWKEMPRNPQGKVLKREIRRMIGEGKKT